MLDVEYWILELKIFVAHYHFKSNLRILTIQEPWAQERYARYEM